MKRFKNTLLVCDNGSLHEEMIRRAIWLAKANKARVTLVNAIDAAPGELARMFAALPGVRSQEVEYEVVEFHRARLSEIAVTFRAEGIDTAK